jgi:5'-nucleotidase
VEGGTVAYAVSGTPADCVKFGVLKLLSRPPDLVVSGINAGFNLGCNVFYSGTVAAVIEGAMYGVRGVAFSCSPHNADRIARMAAQAVRTLKVILEHRGRPALAYNVNLPALGDDDPEIVFTHHWAEAFHERYLPQDAGGVEGFRLDLRGEDQVSPGDGCDVLAIQAGKISVTPLRASLTDYDTLRHLAPPTPG